MKLLHAQSRQQLSVFIFFAFIATVLLAPLASNNTIPTNFDMLNHLVIIMHAKVALLQGQFPLRIAPVEQSGWGYPLFQFYSPSTYTFAGSIYRWLTPDNPLLAYKATLWCALVAGGIYMFRLAYDFVQSYPAAILASVVYLSAPYYIIVIGHMGGFNEAIALGIVPAVLYYTLQRFNYSQQNKTLLQASLSWYLLMTIHMVTFFYLSCFVAPLLIYATLRRRQPWLHLVDVGIAYGFACLLALWYLGPVLVFYKYLLASHTLDLIHQYSAALPALLSPAVGIIAGLSDSISSVNPSIGWPILLAFGIGLYAYFNKLSLANDKANFWLPPLLLLFSLGLILAWSPYNFWQWLPASFSSIQYSWRLLGQLMWIGALLFAWACCWLFQNNLDARHLVLGLLLILTTTSVWFPTPERDMFDFKDYLKTPHLAFNPDVYLLDAKDHMALVNGLDKLLIYAAMPDAQMATSLAVPIKASLIKTAYAPLITIQGDMTEKVSSHYRKAMVYGNEKLLAEYKLTPGAFSWQIPLAQDKKLMTDKDFALKIKFADAQILNDAETKPMGTVHKIILGGFQNSQQVLSVAQMQTHCRQRHQNTFCSLFMPKGISLVELPVLYYPQMLVVTLNGEQVPYYSVLHENRMIAAVAPIPNVKNNIRVQFRGLLWANTLSEVAWGLWVLFLMFITARYLSSRA